MGASPFGQPLLKFYYFEAQVPPDLELEEGSKCPHLTLTGGPWQSLSPCPVQTWFQLRTRGPSRPQMPSVACQEGVAGRGRVCWCSLSETMSKPSGQEGAGRTPGSSMPQGLCGLFPRQRLR